MILALLLSAAQPSSRPADEAITTYLKGCGHVEGPVRFRTTDSADKERQAYACTQKGKTRVAVFSALPSGQQGRQCDSVAVAGTAHRLEHVRIAGVDLLRVVIIAATPDDERVVDQALLVRWGLCKVVAESNILHPLDGPTLREPRAGLELDEAGIDAWTEVARLRFGDRRKVVVAMRGVRIEPQPGAPPPVEIEAEPMEPLSVALASKKGKPLDVLDGVLQALPLAPGEKVTIAHEQAPVRAVRVRLSGALAAPLTLALAGGPTVEWRDKQDWLSKVGVFGYGFLAQKGPTLVREAVAFFDPPLQTQEVELALGGARGEPLTIESVRVLRDVKDWPAFEESEDYGEPEGRAY